MRLPTAPPAPYQTAPTYPVQPASNPCYCQAPVQQTYAPQQDLQVQKVPAGYASAELQKQ